MAPPKLQDATVGIITALTHEHAALCEVLELNDKEYVPTGRGGRRTYDVGWMKSADRSNHAIAATQLLTMGNNSASSRASLMLEHCKNMRVVIMVGISGAVPFPEKPDQHVRLGDIVVVNDKGVIQYDNVKQFLALESTAGFNKGTVQEEFRNPPRPPSPALMAAVQQLEVARQRGSGRPWEDYTKTAIMKLGVLWKRPPHTSDLLHDWEGGDPRLIVHPNDPNRNDQDNPRVFFGPIASANKLLKDPIKRNQLRDVFGVKAVEMESSGIADATWEAEADYFVVRGTCDYCDPRKGDHWQKYAAVVAASYIKAAIEALPSYPGSYATSTEAIPPVDSSLTTQISQLLRAVEDRVIQVQITIDTRAKGSLASKLEFYPKTGEASASPGTQSQAQVDKPLADTPAPEHTSALISSPQPSAVLVTATPFLTEQKAESSLRELQDLIDRYEIATAVSKVSQHEKWLLDNESLLPKTVVAEHYTFLANVTLIHARVSAGEDKPDVNSARAFLIRARNAISS